ncbi:unnamed protein product [Gongylonema pulchrum]|uniref:Uncharacterized protein n=1 Tax=Gongylonema pulchrum TaxID=637853 RepID=A0A183EQK4_9BILA|nr:unnamed protein product [Gongylonema pulchrum]
MKSWSCRSTINDRVEGLDLKSAFGILCIAALSQIQIHCRNKEIEAYEEGPNKKDTSSGFRDFFKRIVRTNCLNLALHFQIVSNYELIINYELMLKEKDFQESNNNNTDSNNSGDNKGGSIENISKNNSNGEATERTISVSESSEGSHISPSETHSSASNGTSPTASRECYECAVYKGKLAVAENRCRYLEGRTATLQVSCRAFRISFSLLLKNKSHCH